jgi:large subunit ribosomal protein L24
VQATLLGFAIALILALITALVGPLLVNWNTYRAQFESHASRLVGRDIHIKGAIDARLLPTPTLVLHGVELGNPDQNLRAGLLHLELALGALVRGELRISNARIEQAEATLTIDEAGRLQWAAPRPSFNPEAVTVERLTVSGGRAVLIHKPSGSRLPLEKVEFRGELRSLVGPLKGDGSFVAAGQHYPYRLSASRWPDNEGVKLRVSFDPIDRPLTAEVDLSVALDQGIARLEGNMQLARLVSRAGAGDQSEIAEPWRLNAHLKGDGLGAVLEELEFQYGPEERAAKLKGAAQLSFGAHPRISGTLASTQIDLDRVLASPGAKPVSAAKMLCDLLNARPHMPLPVNLSIGIESLLLGGAAMQRVGAEVEFNPDQIELRSLEFRAPGLAQVTLKGRMGLQAQAITFAGAASVEANNARAFLTWALDRDAQVAATGPLRFGGKVSYSDGRLAIEEMNLELERMSVAGRLVYAERRPDRPPRLEAALRTPEIDVDRLHTLAKAVIGDAAFEFPREGELSLAVGRATLAGIEVKQADVKARIDPNGIDVEQLSIADFGGARLGLKGRIDTKVSPPRGTMALDVDARTLDGVLSVFEKFAPEQAQQLRPLASRALPLALRATLTLDPGAAGAALASARFKLDALGGRVLRLALIGDASTSAAAFKLDQLAALEAAKVNLIGRIEADDSQALVQLMHIDPFVSADSRPGRLTFSAKGTLDQVLDVDVQLTSGPMSGTAQGKVSLAKRGSPTADLRLSIKNANLWSPRRTAGGTAPDTLPTSASAILAFGNNLLNLQEINAAIADARLRGRLTLALRDPMQIDGQLQVSSLDLPSVVATALGLPARPASASQNVSWSSGPFEPLFGTLRGHLDLEAEQITLTAKLPARRFRGMVDFGESRIALQVTESTVAGGTLQGELIFLREGEGMIGRMGGKLSGADAAELLPGNRTISGRLTSEISVEGSGMSAVALIGSLQGKGTFTLEDGRLARLSPAAFASIIHAIDQGLPIDAVRLSDRMDAALASGPLAVPVAQGSIVIEAGEARLKNSAAAADDTELATTASLDLVHAAIDARLIFTGPKALAFANTRPEIVVFVKGPVEAPSRSVDAAQFASWLAFRAVEQQSRTLDVLEGRVIPDATSASGETSAPKSGTSTVHNVPITAEPAVPRPKPRPRPAAPKPKPAEEFAPTVRAPPAPPRSLSEFFFGIH